VPFQTPGAQAPRPQGAGRQQASSRRASEVVEDDGRRVPGRPILTSPSFDEMCPTGMAEGDSTQAKRKPITPDAPRGLAFVMLTSFAVNPGCAWRTRGTGNE
jgi:hypothetical protein